MRWKLLLCTPRIKEFIYLNAGPVADLGRNPPGSTTEDRQTLTPNTEPARAPSGGSRIMKGGVQLFSTALVRAHEAGGACAQNDKKGGSATPD